MPSKSQDKRVAVQREAAEAVAMKRFYFPSLGRNGLSVEAPTLEEATEKATELHKLMTAAPTKDSSNE